MTENKNKIKKKITFQARWIVQRNLFVPQVQKIQKCTCRATFWYLLSYTWYLTSSVAGTITVSMQFLKHSGNKFSLTAR